MSPKDSASNQLGSNGLDFGALRRAVEPSAVRRGRRGTERVGDELIERVELIGRRWLGDANPPAANRDDRLLFKRLPMPLEQLGH